MAESINMDEMLDEEMKARQRGDELDEEELVEEDRVLDEDDEEDEEDIAEEEEEEIEEESPAPARIPKARLDEVIAQREEARQQAKWLQDQLEKLLTAKEKEEVVIPEYDYSSKESEYVELIIEGETEKAAKLRAEIDRARQAELRAAIDKLASDTVAKSESATKAQIEESRFNALVEVYEKEYSFLDSSSEDYNNDAVETVNTLMGGYMASGQSKSESLKNAVNKVIKFYKSSSNKESLGNRKKEAIKKNIKASKQQPPDTSAKKKETNTSFDPAKASDKEWKSLSSRERAELRGDYL